MCIRDSRGATEKESRFSASEKVNTNSQESKNRYRWGASAPASSRAALLPASKMTAVTDSCISRMA